MDINKVATHLAEEARFELMEAMANIDKAKQTLFSNGTPEALEIDLNCLRESMVNVDKYLKLILN